MFSRQLVSLLWFYRKIKGRLITFPKYLIPSRPVSELGTKHASQVIPVCLDHARLSFWSTLKFAFREALQKLLNKPEERVSGLLRCNSFLQSNFSLFPQFPCCKYHKTTYMVLGSQWTRLSGTYTWGKLCQGENDTGETLVFRLNLGKWALIAFPLFPDIHSAMSKFSVSKQKFIGIIHKNCQLRSTLGSLGQDVVSLSEFKKPLEVHFLLLQLGAICKKPALSKGIFTHPRLRS